MLCAPWAIALLPVGVGVAVGWEGAKRVAFWIAASALALAVAGLAAKVLPGPSQDNAAFLTLMLPVLAGPTRRSTPAPAARPVRVTSGIDVLQPPRDSGGTMLTPAEARALHDEITVIDLHADTPKMMEGAGSGAGFKLFWTW